MSDLLNIADAWINAAKERGINIEDEDGYLAVIRDLAARVRELEAERECLIIDYQNEHKRAERAEAERDFLHKRRGELVIERDRYKAALAEYPEGRDVFLAGALAEVETQRERAERAEAERDARRKVTDETIAAVNQVRAENDALRRDAERLRTEAQRILADTEPDCGEPDCDDCKYWRPLRAAIDQAGGLKNEP